MIETPKQLTKNYQLPIHRCIGSECFWLTAILVVSAVLRFWNLNLELYPGLIFSASFGVITVYLVFLIVRFFFIDKGPLALMAAFLASLNPWLLHLSRKPFSGEMFLAWPATLYDLLARWFETFSGRTLFFEGVMGLPAPYQGIMLLSDIFLLPLGFFAVFRNSLDRGVLILFSVLAFAPMFLSNHYIFVVALVIVSAFGLNFLVASINEQKRKSFLLFTIFLPIIFSIIYFLDAYFVHMPKM
jgi:hypothetical protein